MNEACAEMDRAFTFTELEDKLKARKNLYDCFETSIHAAAAARVARKVRLTDSRRCTNDFHFLVCLLPLTSAIHDFIL